MKLWSDIMRIVAAGAAVYAFYTGRAGDALIILAIVFGTLGFKLRRAILIEPSPAANRWELALTLLFTLNIVFVALNVYYNRSLAFFDIIMHFGGGAVVGWWAYLTLARGEAPAFDRMRALVFIVGAAALLGVAWELFEWALDHTAGAWFVAQKAQPSLDDTMKDLVLDIVGGFIAGIVLLRSRRDKSETLNPKY